MAERIKVIILAAGYGTRLEKDIETTSDEDIRSKLKGVPKPLLPIAGETLITRWIHILENAASHLDTEVNVIVNQKHLHLYEKWKNQINSRDDNTLTINLINDGTTSNTNRLGAIQAIRLGIRNGEGFSKFLVIAGDTLFLEDFNLSCIIDFFIQKSGSVVLSCPVHDEDVSKRGIIEVDQSTNRVISFLEKPQPSETESRLQSPAFYLFNEDATAFLDAYICETKAKPLAVRDAPGHFLMYLIPKSPVYAFHVNGRFDVGGLESYLECCKAFLTR